MKLWKTIMDSRPRHPYPPTPHASPRLPSFFTIIEYDVGGRVIPGKDPQTTAWRAFMVARLIRCIESAIQSY